MRSRTQTTPLDFREEFLESVRCTDSRVGIEQKYTIMNYLRQQVMSIYIPLESDACNGQNAYFSLESGIRPLTAY